MLIEQKLMALAAAYIDDLVTGGSDHSQATVNLDKLLHALDAYNFKVGADKINVGLTEADVLGFVIRDGKLLPDPSRTEPLARLLPPTTRTQLRGYLGLTGYYRAFIRDYARIARPLTTLLKDDVEWSWEREQQAAFEALRNALATTPVLAMPQPDRPYQICTDFCGIAIAAVLE
jgi:RNase H-like domain found in reverse transcriptase